MNVQELHSALKKVQAELSKYGHVNKKALDLYAHFTEQLDDLERRRQEDQLSCRFESSAVLSSHCGRHHMLPQHTSH